MTTTTTNIDTQNNDDEDDSTSSTFDHIFSGWSIWLEPSSSSQTVQEMNELSQEFAIECGGKEKGVYPVPLHCTLLYNFPSPTKTSISTTFPGNTIISVGKEDGMNTEDVNANDDNSSLSSSSWEEEYGKTMLQKCLDLYKQQEQTKNDEQKDAPTMNSTDSESLNTTDTTPTTSTHSMTHANTHLKLVPKSLYYFPYPKEADDGRGFGCVISLMIFENTVDLDRMYDCAMTIFPPDERHGKDSSSSGRNNNNRRRSDDVNADDTIASTTTTHETMRQESTEEQIITLNEKDTKNVAEEESNKSDPSHDGKEEKPKFIPHMSFIYAPEKYDNWLKARTEELEQSSRGQNWLKQPIKAKYLSLWSTQGRLEDWRRITKLEIQ